MKVGKKSKRQTTVATAKAWTLKYKNLLLGHQDSLTRPTLRSGCEFERSMIRQRINAGLKRAVEAGKTLGRPRISEKVEKRIQEQLRRAKASTKLPAKSA
jgi:hypothetical protein